MLCTLMDRARSDFERFVAEVELVEQEIRWEQGGGLWLDANATTENGQPVLLSYTSADGGVRFGAEHMGDVAAREVRTRRGRLVWGPVAFR